MNGLLISPIPLLKEAKVKSFYPATLHLHNNSRPYKRTLNNDSS